MCQHRSKSLLICLAVRGLASTRSAETNRSAGASRFLMTAPSTLPRLVEMIEAIDHIRDVIADVPLESCEARWPMQWLVEHGIEIISEASRHLTDGLEARHPKIPYRRHERRGYRENRLFFPERNITMSTLTEAIVIVEVGEPRGQFRRAPPCSRGARCSSSTTVPQGAHLAAEVCGERCRSRDRAR